MDAALACLVWHSETVPPCTVVPQLGLFSLGPLVAGLVSGRKPTCILPLPLAVWPTQPQSLCPSLGASHFPLKFPEEKDWLRPACAHSL